jgi:redox-sensitive bicupin YhaK (pirin superfamily)
MSQTTLARGTRVIDAPTLLEGEGFEVRRPIPSRGLEAVGPFIMLDHFGPVTHSPGEAKGAPTHPHAGIETLTYLLAGTARHLDSLGNSSVMGPGDAQWMRAGSGIIHDEGADAAFQARGGVYHGVQLWLNMPKGCRGEAPAYRQIDAGEMPTFHVEGATVRLIAGDLEGREGPLTTLTDPFLARVTLGANDATRLAPRAAELAVYLLEGEARVDGGAAIQGRLLVLGDGGDIEIAAGPNGADLLVLGGPPLDAPIVRYGPFVMNSEAELVAAIDAYNAGRFGRIRQTR